MAEVIREAKTKVVHNGERTLTNKTTEQTAREFCESTYPVMMDEYKRIMWEQYETFCKKQRNYGPGNISVDSELVTKDDVKFFGKSRIRFFFTFMNNESYPDWRSGHVQVWKKL